MTALLMMAAIVYVTCSAIIFSLSLTSAAITNNRGEIVYGWRRTVVILVASTLWPVLIFIAKKGE